jgi:hypothetical protein
MYLRLRFLYPIDTLLLLTWQNAKWGIPSNLYQFPLRDFSLTFPCSVWRYCVKNPQRTINCATNTRRHYEYLSVSRRLPYDCENRRWKYCGNPFLRQEHFFVKPFLFPGIEERDMVFTVWHIKSGTNPGKTGQLADI